jgi:hypothetical protein
MSSRRCGRRPIGFDNWESAFKNDIARVDKWAAEQGLSRPEAIGYLVERGLKKEADPKRRTALLSSADVKDGFVAYRASCSSVYQDGLSG